MPPIRRRWLRFIRFLSYGLAALVVLIALGHLVENYRGKRAWTSWKTAQMVKGVRYDWIQLAPPEVPDGENFAKAPTVEPAILGKEPLLKNLKFPDPYPKVPNWRLGQREDIESWRQGYQTRDLENYLATWGPALDDLASASRRPSCRLPMKYGSRDMEATMVPVLGFRAAARILRLRALERLDAGKSNAALADILTIFHVAGQFKDEPDLIVYLLQSAMTNLALQPTWEGLAFHRWDDVQLSRLQTELQKIDLIRSFHRSIDSQRIREVQFTELQLQGSSWDLARQISFCPWTTTEDIKKPHRARTLLTWILLPKGWLYQNMLNIDRFYASGWLPILDSSTHHIDVDAYRSLQARFLQKRPLSPYTWMSQLAIPALVSQTQRMAYCQNGVDEAVVACALERYRLANRMYPRAMAELVPFYLPKIPIDIVDHGTLHYRSNGDGSFTLYSVGWNGTDEGGQIGTQKDDPSKSDIDNGDWTWPQARK